MAVRTSLNVSLTPELDRFVQDRVSTGRYQTASEVIREGLRLLELQERDREAAFDALKAKLQRGASQSDRGELVDPDQVLKRIGALKAQAGGGKTMNRGYAFTPEAEADLLSIWEYIADEDGEGAADRVIQQLYEECRKLGDMSGMGHYREDLLDKRYRFWNIWSYVIAYRWEESPIHVIAIVHGARNLDAFFARRPAE